MTQQDLIWAEPTKKYPAQFVHWEIRSAHWIGPFDLGSRHYTDFNFENFKHALKVVSRIIRTHRDNPVIMGLEGINEPWEHTPPNALHLFNWIR
jgi:glucan 1,3-beta-glucosidase